jgi:hypothetical protein
LRAGNSDVISHTDISGINLQKYDKIFVSAFDPNRKKNVLPKNPLLEFLCNHVTNYQEITYFSSARVLEAKQSDDHKAYITNKIYDVEYLLKKVRNLKIIYLPIIAPMDVSDSSRFFKLIFNNFLAGYMKFDVSQDSSWNIVTAKDVIDISNNLLNKNGRYYICSKTPLFLSVLQRYFLSIDPSLILEYRGKTRHYPDRVNVVKIQTETDLGQDLNWLNQLRIRHLNEK